MPTAAAQVELIGVRKVFGAQDRAEKKVVAVFGADLTIAGGELFAILGPSGSGKTTVLRMIAGFEQPTSGVIKLGGQDVTALPPARRDTNTVFQQYALFPHMTVIQNVEYGLRVRGVAKPERRRRAGEALEMVRLADHATRKPAQLSGGQQQRVALARALVGRPKVLLLDEPLGAIDLKLREQMQVELKAIQREVGITFVIVTHDQDEALTLCDRLAVLNDGRVEQVGAPVTSTSIRRIDSWPTSSARPMSSTARRLRTCSAAPARSRCAQSTSWCSPTARARRRAPARWTPPSPRWCTPGPPPGSPRAPRPASS